MKNPKVTASYTERHTMYNLFPLMARTAVVCVVPKVIDAVHDAFFKTKPKFPKKKKPGTITRKRVKKVDMTPLTQAHYDHIIVRHKQMVAYNRNRPMKDRFKVPQLIELLNKEFGLDKAAPSYSDIYNNRKPRSHFPKAENNEEIFKVYVRSKIDTAINN